jgi:hypothetical protein
VVASTRAVAEEVTGAELRAGASFANGLANVGGFAGNGTPNSTPAPGLPLAGGSGSAGKNVNGADGGAYAPDAGAQVGAGGGGAGWIRINTATGMATIMGVISPDPTTKCFSHGRLN